MYATVLACGVFHAAFGLVTVWRLDLLTPKALVAPIAYFMP